MSGNIAQLSFLTKLNDLPGKLDYIRAINGLKDFGVVFFAKKNTFKVYWGIRLLRNTPNPGRNWA